MDIEQRVAEADGWVRWTAPAATLVTGSCIVLLFVVPKAGADPASCRTAASAGLRRRRQAAVQHRLGCITRRRVCPAVNESRRSRVLGVTTTPSGRSSGGAPVLSARPVRSVVLATVVLIGVAGCGRGDQVTTVQSSPSDVGAEASTPDAAGVCRTFADDRHNSGYGITAVAAAKSTTTGALDRWMRADNSRNGPGTRNYPALADQPSATPLTYCLYRSTNLAPPHPPPPGSHRPDLVFDGVEILVTGPGNATEAAMGPVDQMTRDAATLQTR